MDRPCVWLYCRHDPLLRCMPAGWSRRHDTGAPRPRIGERLCRNAEACNAAQTLATLARLSR